MKKTLFLILLTLVLTGCKLSTEIRPDTIVDIPLEPTEIQTEAITEDVTEATVPVTEPPTESPTEVPTEKTQSSSKGSSGKGDKKKPSSGGSSKKENTTKATEASKPTEPPTETPTEKPTRPAVSTYSPTKLDYAVIDAVNAQRLNAGLSALKTDKKLCTAAAVRAGELSENWSHTRPNGERFSTAISECGRSFSTAEENLYYTTGSAKADDVVSKWMSSDSHQDAILSENVKSIGVATYTADGVTYIVALFIG